MIYYINAHSIDLHKESNMRHVRFFIIQINHTNSVISRNFNPWTTSQSSPSSASN